MVILGLGAAGAYIWTAPKSYQAVAEVLVDPRDRMTVRGNSSVVAADMAFVESQIALIESQVILDPLIDIEGLETDPVFVSGNDESLSERLLAQFRGMTGFQSQPSNVSPYLATLELLDERLDVRRKGDSTVLEIAVWAPDAIRAADIANRTAELYVEEVANRNMDVPGLSDAPRQSDTDEGPEDPSRQTMTDDPATTAEVSDAPLTDGGDQGARQAAGDEPAPIPAPRPELRAENDIGRQERIVTEDDTASQFTERSEFGDRPENGGRPQNRDQGGSQIAKLQAAADDADRAVNAYRSENGLVDDSRLRSLEQQILEAGDRLVASEDALRAMEAEKTLIEAAKSGGGDDRLQSAVLDDLRRQRVDLNAREAAAATTLLPNHPTRVQLADERRALDQEFALEIRRLSDRISFDIDLARQTTEEARGQIADLETKLDDLTAAQVELAALEDRANAARGLFEAAIARGDDFDASEFSAELPPRFSAEPMPEANVAEPDNDIDNPAAGSADAANTGENGFEPEGTDIRQDMESASQDGSNSAPLPAPSSTQDTYYPADFRDTAEIISYARPPSRPDRPNKPLAFAVGGTGGLLLALVVMLIPGSRPTRRNPYADTYFVDARGEA